MKKDFTESGYIEDVVTRIALANPSVAIKLINTGKIVIQTNGTGKIEDVVYSIYGKEVYENILKVDYEFEGYKVTGVIGKPIISRSNRSNQLFFVNHRFVKDKILTSAAEQGFKGLVTIGKHGFLILNIEMDPKKVDVNVHPTKLEVRFQDEGVVFKAVYHAIKETLLKSDLVSNPVKDYNDSNINSDKELEKLTTEATRGITNKDRVAAWSIDGSIKDTKRNYEDLNIEKDSSVNKPEFNEFKNSITDLDENTRKTFIDELTKAKTPEEINKELGKYAELLRKKNEKSEEIKDEKENDNEINLNLENHRDESFKKENDVNENFNEAKEDASKESSNENKENVNEKIEESSEEYLSNKEKEDSQVENKEDNKEENKEDSQIENKEESKEEQEAENEPQDEKEKFEEMYKKLFGRDIETAKKEYENKKKEEEKENIIKPINDNEISLFSNEETLPYQFVGIAFKTYIILTIDDDLYIIDQHAAHERIMYEKVKKNYYSDTEKDCQMMLLPDVITLNNKEMGIFRDNKEMFNRAGFLVEEFGDNTIKLTGVPEFCLKFNTKEIFLETLDELDTVARTAKQELEDKFLATIACKAAVKAHMALSKMEVDSLMKQLLKLPNPFSCPHGRPTAIKMTKNDIEKKFSRRQ